MMRVFSLFITLPLFAFSASPQEELYHKQQSPEVLIIQPKERATDLKEAFFYLKKEKVASDIIYTLRDGTKISGIMDIALMPGGTMLVFKINTSSGIRYHVIPVENILSVNPKY